jgi:hypothetical protein
MNPAKPTFSNQSPPALSERSESKGHFRFDFRPKRGIMKSLMVGQKALVHYALSKDFESKSLVSQPGVEYGKIPIHLVRESKTLVKKGSFCERTYLYFIRCPCFSECLCCGNNYRR